MIGRHVPNATVFAFNIRGITAELEPLFESLIKSDPVIESRYDIDNLLDFFLEWCLDQFQFVSVFGFDLSIHYPPVVHAIMHLERQINMVYSKLRFPTEFAGHLTIVKRHRNDVFIIFADPSVLERSQHIKLH